MKLGMYNKIVFFMMFLSFVLFFNVDVYGLDLNGTYTATTSWTSADSPINITGDVILGGTTTTYSMDGTSAAAPINVTFSGDYSITVNAGVTLSLLDNVLITGGTTSKKIYVAGNLTVDGDGGTVYPTTQFKKIEIYPTGTGAASVFTLEYANFVESGLCIGDSTESTKPITEFNMSNCTLVDSTDTIYMNRPDNNCLISQNIFINSPGIVVDTTAGNVTISYNYFYHQTSDTETDYSFDIKNYFTKDRILTVNDNAFLNAGRNFISVGDGGVCSDRNIAADDNFWNSLDSTTIASMVDNGSCSNVIDISSYSEEYSASLPSIDEPTSNVGTYGSYNERDGSLPTSDRNPVILDGDNFTYSYDPDSDDKYHLEYAFYEISSYLYNDLTQTVFAWTQDSSDIYDVGDFIYDTSLDNYLAKPTFYTPSIKDGDATINLSLSVSYYPYSWSTSLTTTTPSTTAITITDDIDNTYPTAVAGSDQSVSVGSSVTLDGNLSEGHDGYPVSTYTWEADTSSNNNALTVLSSAYSGESYTFTVPSASSGKVLTFKLTVKNASENYDTDTIDITVASGGSSSTSTTAESQNWEEEYTCFINSVKEAINYYILFPVFVFLFFCISILALRRNKI